MSFIPCPICRLVILTSPKEGNGDQVASHELLISELLIAAIIWHGPIIITAHSGPSWRIRTGRSLKGNQCYIMIKYQRRSPNIVVINLIILTMKGYLPELPGQIKADKVGWLVNCTSSRSNMYNNYNQPRPQTYNAPPSYLPERYGSTRSSAGPQAYRRQHNVPPVGADPQLWQWFSNVDMDRSGSITVTELQSALVNGTYQTHTICLHALNYRTFYRRLDAWAFCWTSAHCSSWNRLKGFDLDTVKMLMAIFVRPFLTLVLNQPVGWHPHAGYRQEWHYQFHRWLSRCFV